MQRPEKKRIGWKKGNVTGRTGLVVIAVASNVDIPAGVPARQHIDPRMDVRRNMIGYDVPAAIGPDFPGGGKRDGKRNETKTKPCD